MFVVAAIQCKGTLSAALALALIHLLSDVRTETVLVVRVICCTIVVTKLQFEYHPIIVSRLLHRALHHQLKIDRSSFTSLRGG